MVIHARPSSASYVTSVKSSIGPRFLRRGSGPVKPSAFSLYGLTINILYACRDLNRLRARQPHAVRGRGLSRAVRVPSAGPDGRAARIAGADEVVVMQQHYLDESGPFVIRDRLYKTLVDADAVPEQRLVSLNERGPAQ